MFSRVIDLGDVLTFGGALLLGAGLWTYLGPVVLVGYGALMLGAGLWLSWRNRPRRK